MHVLLLHMHGSESLIIGCSHKVGFVKKIPTLKTII